MSALKMRARTRRFRKLPLRFEALEAREVFSITILDPSTQPKFVNPLPNPLAPAAIFLPNSTTTVPSYEIAVRQFQQSLGLYDPVSGSPLSTTVWGYGTATQAPTYPGRTIVAQKDQQINVIWQNQLVDANNQPLPHLLPVDSTLHWADPLNQGHVEGPYTGPVPVVTHLHGGHSPSNSDGLPDAWFTPDSNDADNLPDYTGRLYNPVYNYYNDQPAATLWYHDHALGITRLNVYAGLAGFYILRDQIDTGLPDNPLGLPANVTVESQFVPYEIPIVIQDRMFTVDSDRPGQAQLYYPSQPEEDTQPDPSVLPEFFGNHILVNGAAWPVLDVEPRAYRFRLLNGSDSRFYNMWLAVGNSPTGPTIYQIGTDSGLMAQPVPLDKLLLGNGERADVVIDFSQFAGQTLTLRNNARGPFPKGDTVDPNTTGQIMQFRVGTTVTVPYTFDPTRPLRPVVPLVQTGPTRSLILFEGEDQFGRLQTMLGTVADGSLLWNEPVTETPHLGDAEVWQIYNATADAHPIHLHLVAFQLISRQRFHADVLPKEMMEGSEGGILRNIRTNGVNNPPAPNEVGWKDTVVMHPGQVTRIIARFDRPGEYVWHCHILSHEDNEMMRPYVVMAGESLMGPSSSNNNDDPVRSWTSYFGWNTNLAAGTTLSASFQLFRDDEVTKAPLNDFWRPRSGEIFD